MTHPLILEEATAERKEGNEGNEGNESKLVLAVLDVPNHEGFWNLS